MMAEDVQSLVKLVENLSTLVEFKENTTMMMQSSTKVVKVMMMRVANPETKITRIKHKKLSGLEEQQVRRCW